MIKIIIIIGLLFISPLGFAELSAHGPYIGGQIGYTDSDNSHAQDSWGARPFVGWRFDDFFALEAGYDHLVDKNHTKIHGFDLMGKAIVPLRYAFSAFIEGALSYLSQQIDTTDYYQDKKKLLPAVGGGIGFNFNNYFTTDVSFLRILGWGGVKSVNYFALGVSVTFPFL